MKMVKRLAGVAAVGVLGLQALPALAQDAGRQEVSVYAGALFGDDVTDRAISGHKPQPVSIADDDGFTLNAGLGAQYQATDHLFLRAEARYRYLDKVVDRLDNSLNTVETTLGVGWQF